MLIFGVTLAKNERIMEEDNFTIHILHNDDEAFRVAVDFLILEIIEVDLEQGTSDGLHLCLQSARVNKMESIISQLYTLKFGEIVDKSMDKLLCIRYSDELSDFGQSLNWAVSSVMFGNIKCHSQGWSNGTTAESRVETLSYRKK